MLQVLLRELDPLDRHKLDQWLLDPQALLLRRCLLAEVAGHQAEAANIVARNADAVRVNPSALDARASKALYAAARLQTFLDVLSELASGKTKFRTAEVQVTETIETA